MRRLRSVLVLLVAVCAWTAEAGASPADSEPRVIVLDWHGDADPVAADYVAEGLEAAAREGASLLVLRLDFPGGSETALMRMAGDIRASQIPVAVYVSPEGTGLAASGARLLTAASVAAMAPATSVGGTTAESALALGLIDVVAADLGDLLGWCDGVSLDVERGDVLRTAGAWILERPPNRGWLFLGAITDPDLAYVLLMVGLLGVLHGMGRRGVILSGVVGGMALLLALVALRRLPTDSAGPALLVLGVGQLRLTTRVISYGALHVGGVAALLLGSLSLYGVPDALSWRLILPTILVMALAVPGVPWHRARDRSA